jgi:hypothetical protein
MGERRCRSRTVGRIDDPGHVHGREVSCPAPVPAATLPAVRRLAFVGQRTFFEACSLGGPRAAFFEFRAGADAEELVIRLEDFAPDVTVVFRPEVVPAGALAGLPGVVVGFLTEPLPRAPRQTNRDLEGRLWELRRADPANFDRIVAFDPLVADVAEREGILPVWRSLPLPVADRFFSPVREARTPPRALFVGRSTEHRERMLAPAKHRFDLLHLGFGVDADRLAGLMPEHDVAVNLHTDRFPSFENRVALHLAAGHLVVSEPLVPLHGLEPGGDFVEVRTPEDVLRALELLDRHPETWRAVRERGRLAAERFRASRVYARLAEDVLADVAAFGTDRARG